MLAHALTLLKVAALPASVELRGARMTDGRAAVTTSAPRELRAPNPDALVGGCVRYAFRKGMKLVLFLQRDSKGRLVAYRRPFSRDAEDVSGNDALWVKAVREYAAISALPVALRRQRMVERVRALEAMRGNADAVAIANDLKVELSGSRRPPID